MEERIGLMKTPISNLQSAYNALYEIGLDPIMVDADFHDYDDITHLIVPGVGHFGAVKRHLDEYGFSDRIRKFAASGRPLLGICVGMQLLATTGTEGGETAGLGLIDARVERLTGDAQLRLPHVGWNMVELKYAHPVLEGVKKGRDFYFVHSYGMHTANASDSLGETTYGSRFTSIVARNNVVGLQFHPEKSQVNGLRILQNFCFWDGKC